MERRMTPTYHSGTIAQILICLAYAPMPWLTNDTVRLWQLVETHGNRWLWAGYLVACAVAMTIGIMRRRATCRHHGLAGMVFFWLATLSMYVSPGRFYSPMSVAFALFTVMAIQTLIIDVRRKPRTLCKNGG